MGYQEDRKWSDAYIPEIKRIVGPYLLQPSSFEIDTKQAADLVIMKARDLTIACRVRGLGYLEKYPNQFTIRSSRDSGAKTELDKILEGFGDWLFYGHARDNQSIFFSRWMIIDLAHWRYHMVKSHTIIKERGGMGQKSNGDGTYFYWFDIHSFPDTTPIVIAENGKEERY